MRHIRTLIAGLTLVPAVATLFAAEMIVQIPVASILNTRCVSTLTDGKVVPWQMGVDTTDGYLTMAACLFLHQRDSHALPDDGKFPADERHPEIVLNYSNADGVSNQARCVTGTSDFTIPVPSNNYANIFLYFTSAGGGSKLSFQINYADATMDTVVANLPDYYNAVKTNDPVFFYVVQDLGKWGKDGRLVERNHHNIHGIELHPAKNKTLASIKVSKPDEKTYLVFWGATGVVSGPGK